MDGGAGVGLMELGLVGAAVLWTILAHSPGQQDDARGWHQRVRCAGCNRWVIRAPCFDRLERYFDVKIIPIEHHHEVVNLHRAAESISSEHLWREYQNAQLWVFDPKSTVRAMVRVHPLSATVDEGLRLHYCTLRLRAPTKFSNPREEDLVRWDELMTPGLVDDTHARRQEPRGTTKPE